MRLWVRALGLSICLLIWMVCVCGVAVNSAHGETWNHRAYASLSKNSPAKSKYVQGVAYDGTRYAYVVKQNVSKHQMLWRVDMNKGGKATKLSVSGKAKKMIYHGNDMEYVKVGKAQYLLVAPCKAKNRYLVVLKVSGKKVTYHKRIYCGFTNKVSAVAKVSQDGNQVKLILGKNSKLWLVTIDLRFGVYYKKHGRVYGYVSNQGIGYKSGYVLACDGGYKTKKANVRKYKLAKSGNNYKLKPVWRRTIKGEAEGAFFDKHNKVCIACEGKWHWHYSDRIVRWTR
ncbi:hypothetical protein [Paratractidigestivibacter sp.]|uniref:hypothetical protein n=1 Tax=Paratractidigestivibacter sp. TaxID=2847316 RepID=UPI002AC8CF0B|nr:hypothetical protein [Paratractidigestivibacter sp.]